jgi:hypothetical protein
MNIKYVFLGNSQSLSKIGEYPEDNSYWTNTCLQVFEKYCNSHTTKFQQRNVINNLNNCKCCFILMPSNVFYFVIAESNYDDLQVFSLIEEINNNCLVLEDGVLNNVGKLRLKTIIESYQGGREDDIMTERGEVVIEMKECGGKRGSEEHIFGQNKNQSLYDGTFEPIGIKKLSCLESCKVRLATCYGYLKIIFRRS